MSSEPSWDLYRTFDAVLREGSLSGAARALGLGATLTTRHLFYEKEVEALFGLPPDVHSYAILPIGYPMGRFGPIRRSAVGEVVWQDRWGQPCPGL